MGSIVFKWAGAPAVTPPAVAEPSEALPTRRRPSCPGGRDRIRRCRDRSLLADLGDDLRFQFGVGAV